MKEKGTVNVKKMVMAAMLSCLSYVVSTFVVFPRMAPFQHMFNVIAAVLLGPVWGFLSAALTGVMRMALQGRTIGAFVGAVVGAFLSGLLYKLTKKLWAAVAGEIIGTGILSALMVYPLMVNFYGLAPESPFWIFIVSYLPSSVCGACIAFVIMGVLMKNGTVKQMQGMLENERA